MQQRPWIQNHINHIPTLILSGVHVDYVKCGIVTGPYRESIAGERLAEQDNECLAYNKGKIGTWKCSKGYRDSDPHRSRGHLMNCWHVTHLSVSLLNWWEPVGLLGKRQEIKDEWRNIRVNDTEYMHVLERLTRKCVLHECLEIKITRGSGNGPCCPRTSRCRDRSFKNWNVLNKPSCTKFCQQLTANQTNCNQRQLETFFMIPPLSLLPLRTLHPQL